TLIVTVVVPVQSCASVAVTLNVNVPACVGVPESVAPLKPRPGGSCPLAFSVYGAEPPEPANAAEYGSPAVAAGELDGATEMPWHPATQLREKVPLNWGAGPPPTMSVPTRSQSGSRPALRIHACRSVSPIGNGVPGDTIGFGADSQ